MTPKTTKKDFITSLLIFFGILILDQVSKEMALRSGISTINKGFIFGIGQGLPAGLRVITLSSLFGFIFFIYLSLIYLLPYSLKNLKTYLAIFMAGISGNVLDRAFRGESIDFLNLNFSGLSSPIFNFADVFQWIGAIFIAYKLIKSEKIIWYPDNQRGQFLINPREQILFSLKMMMASFSSSLLLGLFGLTFLQTTLPPSSAQVILFNFTVGFCALTLVFNGLVFYVGLHLSHRSSGPLYAFELYVEDLLKGTRRELKLREGDNHKHFEKIADDLLTHFKNRD